MMPYVSELIMQETYVKSCNYIDKPKLNFYENHVSVVSNFPFS